MLNTSETIQQAHQTAIKRVFRLESQGKRQEARKAFINFLTWREHILKINRRYL